MAVNISKEELDIKVKEVTREFQENLFTYLMENTDLLHPKGKSYRVIEEETGISRNTLANIVNLKVIPQTSTLIKLALYYDLNINDIFSKTLIRSNKRSVKSSKLTPKEELKLKVKSSGYTRDEQNVILSVIKLVNKKYKEQDKC